MLDCDRNDYGCMGGYLDMGDFFLSNKGVVPASCVKYISAD